MELQLQKLRGRNKTLSELNKKDINPNVFTEKIIKNHDLIKQYLEGLLSKNETYRYNCFKVLYDVSEKKPDLLYHHWNFFVNQLRSNNNYHKMSAVLIIANLASVDKENRFENIFNEFFRAPNAIDRKITGTGLGLAIAKKIAEDHHGDIEVTSKENVGSTFRVTLPIIKDE